MPKLQFTIEDRPGGEVHVHLEQDLPFDTPDKATNAERMAMFVLKFIERQDKKARERFQRSQLLVPEPPRLVMPPLGWTPVKARRAKRGL